MELPIYEITLDNWDMGIFATSIVSKPATGSDFIHMSEQKPITWLFADEEKREVLGAVLVPGKLLYRKDSEGREFFVRFSKEIIHELSAKMHEEGFNKYFTIQHELGAGNTIKFLESWIKETENDKSVAFGINEPIGTLFMKVKINSDLIWENIKEEKLNGFSVELDASMIKTNLQKQSMDFTKLLKNEVVIGEDTLRFNKLELGEIVLQMVEDGDPSFYTGNFTKDGFEYVVEDGNISTVTELEKEPVVLSTNEAIESISAKVDGFIETITTLLADIKPVDNSDVVTTINDLSSKFEEVKLELKQQAAAENERLDAKQDPTAPVEFNVDSYMAAKKWSK